MACEWGYWLWSRWKHSGPATGHGRTFREITNRARGLVPVLAFRHEMLL